MNLPKFAGNTLITSLTDNTEYPEYCLQAALNSDVFQDFRCNEIYNVALEHDSYEQGLEYLEAIKQSRFNLSTVADKFRENDKVGSPRVYEYEEIRTSLVYRAMNELSTEIYDLVISNYAFTEMRRDIQDIYLEKVIYPSLRGYITYNDINPKDFNSYKKEELLHMIRSLKAMPEVGILDETDCILVWHQ